MVIGITFLAIAGAASFLFLSVPSGAENPASAPEVSTRALEVENGIHLPTGLRAEPGYEVVAANCLRCHSSKLVIQNRATRDGWEHLIRWMQATQNLHDLGVAEPVILDYLGTYYAPAKSGRRRPLGDTDWYRLGKSNTAEGK